MELNSGVTKFDLLVNVFRQEETLRMMWEYSSEIFLESTIRRMAEIFVALLQSIAAGPEQRLGELTAALEKSEQLIRRRDDQKRHHTLREKLVQKSRKALPV